MPSKRDRSQPRGFACERCFRDEKLREWIRENGSIGPCPWCRARKAHRVPLTDLAPLFRTVAAIYSELDDPEYIDLAEPISSLMHGDWQIWDERIETAPDGLMDKMAISILTAGLHPKDDVDYPNYADLFLSRHPFDSSLEDRWHERVMEALSGGLTRPPAESPPADPDEADLDVEPDPIEFVLEDVGETYEQDRILHRARIYKNRARFTPFSEVEVGAPPPDRARAGRANRQGQRVLYAASDPQTALAEVRAWKGAAVAIASVRITRRLRILDLSKPRYLDSPFFVESLGWVIEAYALLRRFGEELSRPILPGEEAREYVPSQEVSDLVSRVGYDGIAYPSAMAGGHNVVLFDPDTATVTEILNVRVKGISHEHEEIAGVNVTVDDWPYE